MKNFKKQIRSTKRGVTFNGKQFFTPKMAGEIIEESNEIFNSLK